MKKTPLRGRRHIIEMTDRKKVSRFKNILLFSLDILSPSVYREGNNRIYPFLACIATLRQGILFLTREGMV